ncbi:NACHT domain-containing protein [Kamptonema formosum]|uniref:NACHT domain-containing protein n=1 Tax=Kamptonema formosum TaxID=331992 RepID=UPI000346C396|nr:HEAT repeat domain-containing protein [Oscillatoria sp. PCC 10802]
MNAGEQGRNPEVEAKFLEAMARDCGFAGKTQAVFIQRFNRANSRQENKSLAASVWPNQDEAVNREQTFQDHLQTICQKLELAGGPIVKSNKPGRRRKGEEPWNLAFKWLWETEFPNWQSAQEAESPSPTAISIDWRQVCRTRLDVQRQLTSNLFTHADGIELDLDGVYVPLGLVERKERPKRDGDVSPERGSELSQPTGTEIEIAKKYESDEFFQEALLQGKTPKSQGKRLLIAGEPGAGKTTLLQKSAGWVLKNTDLVPVWISLGAVGDIPLDKYLQEVWLRDAAGKLKSAPPEWLEALEQLLDSGKVLLLLDGADEMGVANPLAALNEQLRAGWAQKVRVMLSCRVNVWDATPNALTGFDTYRTLEFSCGKGSEPDRVGEFIDNFFKNSNSERGKQLRAALDEPGKERIKDLVKNPLRLTLLCRTWHKREGGLPETKAQLYEQFVKALYIWKGERFPTKPKQQKALNAKLGELALRAMGGESSRFRLRHNLVCQVLGDPEDEESLGYWALKLGWINTVGVAAENPDEPVYAFYHPTFEEYFAARAIGDDWRFFLNHTLPPSPSMSNYRIFEPQWKEVILLWLGREDVARERKEEFIKALVEFEDGCGDFYRYRAYFLAAAGVAEFKDCSRADEIVAQIVKWFLGDFKRNLKIKKQDLVMFFDPMPEVAREALLETERTKAIKPFEEVIRTSQYESTRRQAVESLGEIGQGSPTAIDALVDLIRTSQDEYTRRLAVDSLGKIGQGSPTAIAALVELIRTSQDEYTRRIAAWSLGKIDPGNPIAIAALVELIRTSQNRYTRWNAAEILGEIDQGNLTAIAALEKLIHISQDGYNRPQVVCNLEEIGQGNLIAFDACVDLIRTSLYKSTRRRAAESLEKIDQGNPTAIAARVELIRTSQDENTRRQAAWSLPRILEKSQMALAVTGLKDFLSDETYENDFEQFKDCYNVIWHCAQTMPYPEFYQAWHTQTTGTPPQSLTLANLPQVLASAIARQAQLQESVKLICINAETLSGETDTGEIAQHLCNNIYSAAFPNSTEIPPEVNSAAQLARQLTALKCRVKTPALALILHSCAPEPALVKFCRKLTDTAHIGWIAGAPVESPLRGFPQNQPNLVSEILSWLDELAG